jgi:hypothetical protein
VADNITLDPGAGGSTVATDDAGAGGHVQLIKLAASADGSASVIPADTTDGLTVILAAQGGVDLMDVTVNNGVGASAVPIQDGGNTITVDGTVAVTHAALTELAGAIDTEMQVDVVAALPAGNNNIGDVDVASVVPGVGATNLGKAEDAAHTSGDVGVMALTVRQDTAAALGQTDADYQPVISDASGRVHVNVGASALPTGAATSAKQDTGNTSLGTIAGAVSGTEMQVDVLTMPSTAVTNAGLTALNGAIAGTEVQVDVLTMPSTTVTATNLDVRDLVAASDAVTVHGDVGALDQLDLTNTNPIAVAMVDGDGTQITSFGGGTQYAEDTQAAAGEQVTMAGVVRLDAAASLVGADGDRTELQVDANGALRVTGGGGGTEYVVDAAAPAAPTGATFVMERDDALAALTEVEGDWTNPRSNANGALWVKQDGTVTVDGSGVTQPISHAALTELAGAIDTEMQVDVITMPTVTVNAHAVTNAGTFVTQIDGSALTALQLIDDPVATLGTTTYTETTTKGMIVGAVRRDADTTLVDTTNEVGPLQMNAAGQLKVEVFTGETLPVSLASVPSHAVTNAGTFVTQVDGAALTSLQLADDVVAVLGTDTYTETTTKGNIIGAVRRDADTTLVGTTNEIAPLQVDANGRLKVEVFSGETLPISGTVTASNTAGDVAHDTGDSGNPVKIGAKAVSAEPAVVTANDRVNLLADLVGKLIVLPYANPENFVSGAITTAMTATTSTSLIASPGAGLRNYITQITVSNSHATVGTDVAIQDGSGGTVLYTIPAAAVYGGGAITFPTPLRQPTVATALFCVNVTTGASTKVSASGYKGV